MTARRRQSYCRDELPSDPIPSIVPKLFIGDTITRPHHTLAIVPNPKASTFVSPSLLPSSTHTFVDEAIAKSLIPPRPKPPVPSEFFIYPERSWRSMSKEAVRAHVAERFAVRQRYTEAYAAWEEQHNKWTFGVHHLMQTIKKSQQRAARRNNHEEGNDADVEANDEATVMEGVEAGSQVATELKSDTLDSDLDGSALTVLQEDAEVDDQERDRRWFISRTKRHDKSSSKPLFPALKRSGPKGFFGLSAGRQQLQLRRTPSIELPQSVARKINTTVTLSAPSKPVERKKRVMDDSSASESEDNMTSSELSWRIYSRKCACGYAHCHCHSWCYWWDKTLDMLAYVEYVDIPITPSPMDPAGLAQFARFCLVEGPTPFEHDPLLSLETSRQSSKRPADREKHSTSRSVVQPNPRYFKRVLVERSKFYENESKIPEDTEMDDSSIMCKGECIMEENGKCTDPVPSGANNADERRLGKRPAEQFMRAPSHRQALPKLSYSAVKLQWEDFVEENSKVPTEYSSEILKVILSEIEPASTLSVLDHPDRWRSRSRSVHWIAYIHYSRELGLEIFFLAINLLDQYLARAERPPYGAQWNSFAVACLWSAWKFESDSSSVDSLDTLLTFAEPRKISRRNVIDAEWALHRALHHNMAYSSPVMTMRLGLMGFDHTREMAYLARFLIDVSVTVEGLVAGRPTATGTAAVWLARELMGVPGYNQEFDIIREGIALSWQVSLLIRGVLKMPDHFGNGRDYALFYKWTLPEVNNIAGWCQAVLRQIWPHSNIDQIQFEEGASRLRCLIQSNTIPPFELGPGPPSGHPLFEA